MFAVQIILCVRAAEESEESAAPAEELAIIFTYVDAQTHTTREQEQCSKSVSMHKTCKDV